MTLKETSTLPVAACEVGAGRMAPTVGKLTPACQSLGGVEWLSQTAFAAVSYGYYIMMTMMNCVTSS